VPLAVLGALALDALLAAGIAAGGTIAAFAVAGGIVLIRLGLAIALTMISTTAAATGKDVYGIDLTPERRRDQRTYATVNGALTVAGGLSAGRAIQGMLAGLEGEVATAGAGADVGAGAAK
jgi:hypothetical protein